MGWGMYIGSRRELLWTLRAGPSGPRPSRSCGSAQARGNERARIAREMHDVLAHRISQISMHAGALAFREDLAADADARQRRGDPGAAHEALDDLRGVLGVLRDDRTGELARRARSRRTPTSPELVAEARAAGLHVEFDDRVARRAAVPDGAAGRSTGSCRRA